MKEKVFKSMGKLLIQIVITTLLLLAIQISMEGMYLIGIPNQKNVQKFLVSYPALTEEVKEFTDEKSIDLGLHLSGFLKYAVLEKYEEKDGDEPLITITYILKNGQEVQISANRTTVWWKGNAHVLKTKNMFVNLAEGIFFLGESTG